LRYEDKPGKFEECGSNIKNRSAIEPGLEIINEAVNRILKRNKGLPLDHPEKITGTHNRIIHDKI